MLYLNKSLEDHCTPGCEGCERGYQCGDCDWEDRNRSDTATCAPEWIRRRDLLAEIDAYAGPGMISARGTPQRMVVAPRAGDRSG